MTNAKKCDVTGELYDPSEGKDRTYKVYMNTEQGEEVDLCPRLYERVEQLINTGGKRRPYKKRRKIGEAGRKKVGERMKFLSNKASKYMAKGMSRKKACKKAGAEWAEQKIEIKKEEGKKRVAKDNKKMDEWKEEKTGIGPSIHFLCSLCNKEEVREQGMMCVACEKKFEYSGTNTE